MPNYKLTPVPVEKPGAIVAGDPNERQIDRLLLGKLAESGARRELWLDVSGEQVVGIFGKRGTGKSYSLGVLLEGLSVGQGNCALASTTTPRSGLVFDILDIFWTSVFPLCAEGTPEIKKQYALMHGGGLKSQKLNLEIWIPAGYQRADIDPKGVKPLYIQASDLSIDDWGSLFELNMYSEPRGMLLADIIQHILAGYKNKSGKWTTSKPDYSLGDMVECLDGDPELATNYNKETIRSVRQRLETYNSLPVFSKKGTRMDELLIPFRTTILMLNRVPDQIKNVIIAVLLRRIMRERSAASFARKRLDLDGELTPANKEELEKFVKNSIPRSWILIDEAHVVAGAGTSSVASEALIKFAKEGRNCGLSIAFATQQPSALDSRLLSQVETAIVHQLTSPDDISAAIRGMKSPEPSEIMLDTEKADLPQLFKRLGRGEAVFSSGNAPALRRSCVVAVRPRIVAHGGYEA